MLLEYIKAVLYIFTWKNVKIKQLLWQNDLTYVVQYKLVHRSGTHKPHDWKRTYCSEIIIIDIKFKMCVIYYIFKIALKQCEQFKLFISAERHKKIFSSDLYQDTLRFLWLAWTCRTKQRSLVYVAESTMLIRESLQICSCYLLGIKKYS